MNETNAPAAFSPEQIADIHRLAHDFNNQLCLLTSYAELLRDRLPQSNANQYVTHISTAAKRSSELLKELLAITCNAAASPPIVLNPLPSQSAIPAVPAPHKKLCILAADDEEILLQMVTEMLALSGHDVMKAANGREAVEIFCAHHQHIDLVLLDFKMPILDGKSAFRAMKQINPAVKVILLSGSALNSDVQTMFNEGLFAFLQKPYSKKDLDELIAKAM